MLLIDTQKTGFSPFSRAEEIAKGFNASLEEDDDTKAIVVKGDSFAFVEIVEIDGGHHVAWIDSELAASF